MPATAKLGVLGNFVSTATVSRSPAAAGDTETLSFARLGSLVWVTLGPTAEMLAAVLVEALAAPPVIVVTPISVRPAISKTAMRGSEWVGDGRPPPAVSLIRVFSLRSGGGDKATSVGGSEANLRREAVGVRAVSEDSVTRTVELRRRVTSR